MSVAKAAPAGHPPSGPYTVEVLDSMPDDGRRYELIDGVLVVSPAPLRRHQRALKRLLALLAAAETDEIEVLPAPFSWVSDTHSEFQPDLVVFRRADATDRRLGAAPLLCVEILSPSTRTIDLGTKRLAFAARGVPWYWIVDPRDPDPSITVLRLRGDDYVEHGTVRGNDVFTATDPLAVQVCPAELIR